MTSAPAGPRRMALVASTLERHAGDLRAFVAARLPTAEVDDALQCAAVRAVERCESLKDEDRILAWLYRVHRNVVADTLRSRAARERAVDAIDAPLDAPETDAAEFPCDCSLAQARQLNPRYAEVLALVDLGDSTVPEAAAQLGVSMNNLNVRLHRARKALRAAMLAHCGVATPRDCVDCRCVEEGCCDA